MKLKLHILFILFCINTISNAQTSEFEHLISDNSVYCMAMDKDNVLWIGTEEGLVKYDSKNFKYYYYEPRDSSSLLDNSIRSILIDSRERIWLGTRNGLNRYNRKDDNFIRYAPSSEKNKLHGSFITSIIEDHGGYIWIGTESSGLNRLNPETGYFNHFTAGNTPSSLICNNIESMSLDDNGGLWLATKQGVDYLNINTGELTHYYHISNVPTSIPSNNLTSVEVDNYGLIWTGSRDGYLSCLDRDDIFHYEKEDFSVTSFYSTDDILLIGTDKGKVYSIESEPEPEISFEKLMNRNSIGIVRDLYVDRWYNTWAGTEKGLFVNYSLSRQFYSSGSDADQFFAGSLKDILIDRKDRAWIADESNVWIKDKERIISLKSMINDPVSSRLTRVYTIYEDSKGLIWLGTFTNGLFRFDPSTNALVNFRNDPAKRNTLAHNCIWTITEDQKSDLWIGSWGGGLIKYKRDRNEFINYRADQNDSNSLSNDKIITLKIDSEGILWIGTDGGGLNRFNPLVERFEHFTSDNLDPLSLTDNSILSILEDSEKRLWIGTDGGGLLLLNKEKNNFKIYNQEQGLSNASVKGILEDKQGKLWLSTNGGGIFMFIPDEERFIQFTTDDGLSTNRFNTEAAAKDNDGMFYFAGKDGFTYFNPFEIETDNISPKIVLTSIFINNKDHSYSEDYGLLSIEVDKTILLRPSQRILRLDFSAIEYSYANRNKYRYRISGLNDEWINLGAKPTVSFMNLPHGNFELEIQCSNMDGIWSPDGKIIMLHVLPPFYKTAWFIISVGVLLSLLIFFFNRMKIRDMKERQLTLQRMVDERTAEVRSQSKKLELQNTELEKQKSELARKNENILKSRERLRQMTQKVHEADEMKLRFFTNISHEFRTPLTLILGPLEDLINKFKYDDKVLDHLLTMRRNAGRLLRLIGQVMEFRKIDSGNLKLKASNGDLSKFAKNVADSFKEYAKQKKIDLIFHSEPKSINLHFDTDKLEKILYNLLSNAFRFTPEGGKVELRISETDDEEIKSSIPFNNDQVIKITVSDSGKGIPAKDLKYIFERFYQVKNPVSTSNDGGAGIGLALTKNLVQLHKGTIRVKSEENKGTTFEILLPGGKSHLSKDEIIETPAESVGKSDGYLYDNLLLEKGITPVEHKKEEEITTGDEKLSILLAEDNQELREYLVKYFSEKFIVMEANDGREALNICREHFPDVIISDIMMPEMDGLELCNSIKTDPETCHIPVILLTAKTSIEDRIKGLEHQADTYISKPFSPKALTATVNNLIENRNKLQEKYRRDILLEPEEIELKSNEEILLKKAMQVVEENISNPEFNVNMMSQEVGVSRAALYRKLKALTNLSVNVFVRNIRLKRAAQLLEQNKISISEVAYLVGYNDVQYFRKCFTKQYNLTPSQYIDKHSVKTKE